MSKNKPVYTINVIWDGEADVFVATSDDIPGLVTEAGSFSDIVANVMLIAPDLLELNKETKGQSGDFVPEWLSFNHEPFFVPFKASSVAGHCG